MSNFSIREELPPEKAKDADEFARQISGSLDNRVYAEFTDGHVEDITENPRYAYLVDVALKKDVPKIKDCWCIRNIETTVRNIKFEFDLYKSKKL